MSIAFLTRDAVRRRDVHRAVVLDLDRDAGLRGDAADGLAARADDLADLVGLDLHRVDARRVAATGPRAAPPAPRPSCPGCAAGPRAPGRSACLEDLAGQPLDLDVHLDGGDALLGAADLEVHVAQVILVAEDVGQDGDAVAFLDQAHRDAGHRRLDRNAARPSATAMPPQTDAIDELPLDSRISDTIRIV